MKEQPVNSRYEVTVIGAGPAGMAAAAAALNSGAESVLLLDREYRTGGILNQCIHDGFGLYRFVEVLTGPEYGDREEKRLFALNQKDRLTLLTGTFVLSLEANAGRFCLGLIRQGSYLDIESETVILAMGCRERTAGAISLAGTRPAGIFTAGTAQRLMNMQNTHIGKSVLIIGSGDIGLIMARRLTLEGAEVKAVTEINPFPGGLERNIRQCLHDFSIPLLLSTAIVSVHGKKRVEGVTIAPVDANGILEADQSQYIPCDTVLLSVGLVPEHELVRAVGAQLDPATGGPVVDENLMTSIPGLFACGNLLHVHDLADYASQEAEHAGNRCTAYLRNREISQSVPVTAGKTIRYVLPQHIRCCGTHTLSFRVEKPVSQLKVTVITADKTILEKRIPHALPSEMIRLEISLEELTPLEVSGE